MMNNKKEFCVTAWQGRCINSECPNYITRAIADKEELPALIVQMKHKDCGFKPKEEVI